MKLSSSGTYTFDPKLNQQKEIKDLLGRYSVKTLEELVAYIDKIKEPKEEINEELQDFLNAYFAKNLKEVQQN